MWNWNLKPKSAWDKRLVSHSVIHIRGWAPDMQCHLHKRFRIHVLNAFSTYHEPAFLHVWDQHAQCSFLRSMGWQSCLVSWPGPDSLKALTSFTIMCMSLPALVSSVTFPVAQIHIISKNTFIPPFPYPRNTVFYSSVASLSLVCRSRVSSSCLWLFFPFLLNKYQAWSLFIVLLLC